MERMSDEEIDALLKQVGPYLSELDETDEEPTEIPVPPELRERVLARARQASGMLAAAEARAKGVEIEGWEPTSGADASTYYLGKEGLQDLIRGK